MRKTAATKVFTEPKKMDNQGLIESCMKQSKKRGNYKNYVVISGTFLLDYLGDWQLNKKVDDKIILVHKRFLWKIVDRDFANLFWCKKTNRRKNTRRGLK